MQVTVVEPLVAVIVTVSPSVAPLTPTVGVVSFVSLSLVELPVSEELSRSGVFGDEIAVTVTRNVDDVALLKTSVTEYESVASPVNPPDAVNVTMPVEVFTVQSPSPLTVTLCSAQVGGVSLTRHRNNELAIIPVPRSLSIGDKVMLLVTVPDAESVRAVGRAGG